MLATNKFFLTRHRCSKVISFSPSIVRIVPMGRRGTPIHSSSRTSRTKVLGVHGKNKTFQVSRGKKRVSMGEIVGDIKILGVHGRKANKSDVSTEGKNNIFQYILLPCPTTAAAPSASASPPSRGDRQLRGLLLAGLFILFPITAVHRKKKCPQEKFLGVHAEELLLAALFILSSSNNGLRRNKLP